MSKNKFYSSQLSNSRRMGRKNLRFEIKKTKFNNANEVCGEPMIVKVRIKGTPAIVKTIDRNNPDITVFSIRTPHGTYESSFSHKEFNASFIEAKALILSKSES